MNGDYPFVERDVRILKDRSNRDGERLAASFTLPESFARLTDTLGFEFGLGLVLGDWQDRLCSYFVSFTNETAMWTCRTFRPLLVLQIIPCRVYRGESFH